MLYHNIRSVKNNINNILYHDISILHVVFFVNLQLCKGLRAFIHSFELPFWINWYKIVMIHRTHVLLTNSHSFFSRKENIRPSQGGTLTKPVWPCWRCLQYVSYSDKWRYWAGLVKCRRSLQINRRRVHSAITFSLSQVEAVSGGGQVISTKQVKCYPCELQQRWPGPSLEGPD